MFKARSIQRRTKIDVVEVREVHGSANGVRSVGKKDNLAPRVAGIDRGQDEGSVIRAIIEASNVTHSVPRDLEIAKRGLRYSNDAGNEGQRRGGVYQRGLHCFRIEGYS